MQLIRISLVPTVDLRFIYPRVEADFLGINTIKAYPEAYGEYGEFISWGPVKAGEEKVLWEHVPMLSVPVGPGIPPATPATHAKITLYRGLLWTMAREVRSLDSSQVIMTFYGLINSHPVTLTKDWSRGPSEDELVEQEVSLVHVV